MMASRQIRRLRMIACVALAGAYGCDASADRSITGTPSAAALDVHGSWVCVAGAASVFVSVYPSQLEKGVTATPYASVSDAAGTPVQSNLVTWTVADTAVVAITGTDADGRPILTARGQGSTSVIGSCGSISGSASVTVGDGVKPADTAGATTVSVTLPDTALAPGQTVQAVVHAEDAAGNQVSTAGAVWKATDTGIATVTGDGSVTAIGTGVTAITATLGGAVGSVALTVSSTVVSTPPEVGTPPTTGVSAAPPELPRAGVPDAQYVTASGRTIRVESGGDLQGALDAAQPGDQVLLAAGATFVGNFILQPKATANPCNAWVTVTTETALPAPGTRATPQTAASFAKISTPNVDAALKTSGAASCWRVVGVEITVAPSFSSLNYGIVLLGNGDASSLSEVPHGLVLDRVYVHGQPTTNFVRCVALNSARSAVVNSWISDCHARGFDSQAIAGWNGPGPYLIENNFLSAAGENTMFGGADPKIAGLVPSDITIRHNHFYKDPAWKGVWTVKNLFELKNARRLLIEGNIFENNWADAQTGMAIVIKSSNDGGTAPQSGTTDVTFRYNIVRNSPAGLNLQAIDGGPAVMVARVAIENNVLEAIGSYNGTESGRMLILTHGLADVAISNNTMIHNTNAVGTALMMDYAAGSARNIVIRDNIATKGGPYGALTYSGARIGSESMIAMAGSSWSFDRNVVIGLDAEFVPWHPQSSWYPFTMNDVGFANAGAGDYRLGSSSPYRGKATNGGDPGANIDELLRMTSGVVMR
jgi:hypothetical protein